MFFRLVFFLFINVLLLSIVPGALADPIMRLNRVMVGDVAHQLQQNSVPGGAYAIVQNGKIIAVETFGHLDKAKSAKVDDETVFRLASVSKTFAGTLTTMLANEKLLSLTDPVTKYVPHFTLAKRGAADKIQLKHLLSHSSGLMPNAYDNLLHENWSMDKITRRFDRVDPICKPDKCYGYQNVAFSFLQPAIEASQSKSYPILLQERIFTPLKMHNASVGIEVFRTDANTAKPHVLRKRIKSGKKDKYGDDLSRFIWRTVKVAPDFYKVAPAAGVNASITDLAKWLIANLGHKPEVLSKSLIREVTKERIKTKKALRRKIWRDYLTDAHYGYGWRIYRFNDNPIIYHSGWVAGFVAEVGYSPELDLGFAMLINAESNVISKVSSRFWAEAHKQADLAAKKP